MNKFRLIHAFLPLLIMHVLMHYVSFARSITINYKSMMASRKDSIHIYILDDTVVNVGHSESGKINFSIVNVSTHKEWVPIVTMGGHDRLTSLLSRWVDIASGWTSGLYYEILDSNNQVIEYPCRTGHDFSCIEMVCYTQEAYTYDDQCRNFFSNIYSIIFPNSSKEQRRQEYEVRSRFSLFDPYEIMEFKSKRLNDIDMIPSQCIKYNSTYRIRLVLQQDSIEMQESYFKGSISESTLDSSPIFNGIVYSNSVPMVFRRSE